MRDDLIYVEHEKPYRYTEEGLHVTRGSAWSGPGCHDGCGVLLYTDDDGKLVKVEGDPENPYNQGRLCVRCLALPEAINGDKRLRHPMKRAGKRGEDSWEVITWDEAFDTIEERFNYYKEHFGAESISFWVGTGRDIFAYESRLCWSLGSPNYSSTLNGLACYAPRVYGMISLSGSFWVGDYSQQFVDRYDNPEWRLPEVVLVWGNNPVYSNSDGMFGHWLVDVMQRGSKIVVIDPRMTWLASRSELWIQLRPGTDAALALGMCNVIINEDLYDHEFVDTWVYGFEQFKEVVQKYDPETVAEICWTDADKVRRAARMFAQANGGILQWGVAVDQKEEAITSCQALASILMLTGNIDNPGGMIKPPEVLMNLGGWGAELVSPEQDEKRLGPEKYPFYKEGMHSVAPLSLIEAMETGKPYPIKAAWIQTTNFLTCMGVDPVRTKAAFETLDFIVVVDLFKTPTLMALADIVLPATMYPERNGIRTGDGVQHFETINKAADPGDTKSDMEINLEMGRRFNPEAWPWESVEEMFAHIYNVEDFEKLAEVAPAYVPFEYYKYKTGKLRPDGKPGFNTPTGRLELYSTLLEHFDLPPMPEYSEPSPGPIATPDLFEQYPLVLTTGARNPGFFHAENRENPRLRALHPEPILQMNPETANSLGLTDGEWVWVEGPKGNSGEIGRCKRVLQVTPILEPRVVSTDHAWWHPEGDPEKLYDVFDLNVNQLMEWHCGPSGVGGNYKCVLCKVYRVGEGE